jgi:YHS domain-containing protein
VIRRLLVLVLLALVAAWWWKRLVAATGRQRRRDAVPPREPARELGPMVRDRICNTFLPRSRALSLRAGGEDHFFCSEACRSKFLEQTEIRTA